MNKKYLEGKKFGKLTVINRNENKASHWDCQCECGNKTTVRTAKLTTGVTKSCGCLRVENSRKLISSADNLHVESLKSKVRKDSLTGIKGVAFAKDRQKYRVWITLNYERIYVGQFDTLDEAITARKIAEKEIHAPFAQTNQKRHATTQP